MNFMCTDIQDRLIAHQVTATAGEADAAVLSHLETCVRCRQFREQLNKDHELLSRYAQSVDPLAASLPQRMAQRLATVTQEQRNPRLMVASLPIAIAAAVLLAAVLWAVLHRSGTPPVSVREPTPTARQTTGPSTQAGSGWLEVEQAQANALFAAHDIDGLMALLDSGLAPTQVLVAGYLADLGATEAIPTLQRLGATWTGDPDKNPFAQALDRLVEKISDRESSAQKSQPLSQTMPSDKVIEVHVVEEGTDRPLAGVSVKAYTDQWRDYVCDANGVCRVEVRHPLPGPSDMQVSKAGYVGMLVRFNTPSGHDLRVALQPGICIGGVVQDVNGVPIENAKIDFYAHIEQRGREVWPYVGCQRWTDAAGRWSFDGMPADTLGLMEETPFELAVEHPNYSRKALRITETSVVNALLEQTWRITLYEGSTVRGRVVTAGGEPISGAKVCICHREELYSYTTGPDGTFALAHIDPGQTDVVLEVRAKGYALLQKWVEGYEPGMAPVEIVLGQGHMLSGQVMDTRGVPVADAEVEVYTRAASGWTARTDAAGWFALEPIDTDRVQVTVRKDGFMTESRWMDPTDQPLRFICARPLHASGAVVDALTDAPIERFTIRPCTVSKYTGKVGWGLETLSGRNGRFEYVFKDLCPLGYAIVIEAPGHLPAQSRIIDPNEEEVTIDLALAPGTGSTGTVVDANGLPVAGALVYVTLEDASVSLDQGWVVTVNPKVKADQSGRFSMVPLFHMHGLVAVAEQGICGVTIDDFERTKFLVLRPWAEVRGTVRLGDAPACNWPLETRSVPENRDTCGYETLNATHTDEQGVFRFTKVAPGELTLLGKTFQAAPGEIVTLDLTIDPDEAAKGMKHP